jgi:sRNA-binding protein
MSKKRARTKTVVAELAARFPKCFAVPDGRRRPLKIGIDADLMAALGETVPRTELIRALAMYCSSTGYLAGVLSGAPRVDLRGKPAGIVTADDEKHAKAKRAQIRAKRNVASSVAPRDVQQKYVAAAEPKAESPNRLSLTDLREAARRRRNEGR